MKKLPTVSYSIIGKYRSELMGIAMLNVLVLHSLSWTGFSNPVWAANLLNIFGRLLFTEIFLFLSGYGLYYSLYKNGNIGAFYIKRAKRLVVPFWIMTFPFFVAWFLMMKYGFGGLIMRLSTLQFWFHGNYSGMWYIAISVFLYLCFPLIFRILHKRWGGGNAATLNLCRCHHRFVFSYS